MSFRITTISFPIHYVTQISFQLTVRTVRVLSKLGHVKMYTFSVAIDRAITYTSIYWLLHATFPHAYSLKFEYTTGKVESYICNKKFIPKHQAKRPWDRPRRWQQSSYEKKSAIKKRTVRMWVGIQMTQCWFQQQDSKTNVRSSLLSEVGGFLEDSNIRTTQNVRKKDNINLILKESAKVKTE